MLIPVRSHSIRIKTPEQIDGIRKSCRLAVAALDTVQDRVVSGATTAEINALIAKFISDNGAISATLNYKSHSPGTPAYPAESCISVNEGVCHGIPDNRTLVEGDVVKVDVTTVLNGYFGDTCRTFAVGKVTKRAQDLIEATEQCLNIGVFQVRPGNRFGNIGHQIAQYAHSQGYSVVDRFCGHGVGLEFHEEPAVPHIAPKDSGAKMEPGMIFTIEPMICLGKSDIIIENDGWTVRTADRKLSAQFEHTLLVTPTGVEILTVR